ncbi:hypothetical protein [Marinomonas mediterranea]|uniref:Uncharacterized protein n=2 Tax=Marinomonas mediterranea TaxID=119864 RepID=F2JYY8_MARM1|nr:hypothetical protein [Marinomonas mediterranea]ADZ90853.1 hypothetical protein Marme_1589 [Marinomonas mediterranea MMB-1]WCN08902.1 hypothetical protein GV055_08200 [Marinomonas mediterranea]WCN17005.1 hypothetical protein GV053_08070 [Marinomonas mediterranea MMB-1]
MNRFFVLLIGIFFFLTASFANAGNDYICAQSDNLFCGKNTTFSPLGKVAGAFQVYNYSFVFGSAQRMSKRVIFLDLSGKLIGIYAVPEAATAIQGSCVIFPFEARTGNSICFKQGELPQVTWLDGEHFELYQ